MSIRGDVAAPAFRKVEGYRFVYAADFETEHEIHAVNELDTLRILGDVPNVIELDSRPASFHFDAEAGTLYVSTSDLLSADRHRYSISLLEGSGIALNDPRRVRLEGLSVTGFGGDRGSGISLSTPIGCVIRDCNVYFNNAHGIQIGYRGGRHDPEVIGSNVIERCAVWATRGRAGILITSPRKDIIRNSKAFLNSGSGISVYTSWHREEIAARLLDNLAWGNGSDYGIKAWHNIIIERSVGPGSSTWEVRNWIVRNSLIGELARGLGERFTDNIHLSDMAFDFDPQAEFADPANHDYRLQATSRFRGAGADGGDLGLPYEANLFYVSPEGDDEADGRSIGNAWATLARAADALSPGDTLYLASGRYSGDLVLNIGAPGGAPVSVRGRGEDAARIVGDVVLEGAAEAVFERLDFAGRVTVRGGQNIDFRNCAFQGASPSLAFERVEGSRVTRCFFDGHFFGRGCGQGVLWNPIAVYAWDTEGLWMENCVIIRHGMGAMRLLASTAVIRNSVFIRPKISQLLIENFSDQKVRLENSIFTETLPYKADVGMITSGRAESLEADNVAFYLRLPDAARKPFFVYDQEAWERMFFVQEAIERGDNDERSASVIKTLKSISAAEFSERIHPGFFWFGDPRFAGTVGRESGNYSDRWLPLIRDFPDAFVTEPELIERGIGLDPAAFADFHFNQDQR